MSFPVSNFLAAIAFLFLPATAQANQLCVCPECIVAPMNYEHFTAQAGSMLPGLTPGDCIVMLKTHPEQAQRGDVIIFQHPQKKQDWIMRLIGQQGDVIQMKAGEMHLNGQPVDSVLVLPHVEVYKRRGPISSFPRCKNEPVAMGEVCLKDQKVETLPNGRSYPVLDISAGPLDDTAAFTVPAGHVFVMGDNRDNAKDSRTPQSVGGVGFVPVDNVKGIYHRHITK